MTFVPYCELETRLFYLNEKDIYALASGTVLSRVLSSLVFSATATTPFLVRSLPLVGMRRVSV